MFFASTVAYKITATECQEALVLAEDLTRLCTQLFLFLPSHYLRHEHVYYLYPNTLSPIKKLEDNFSNCEMKQTNYLAFCFVSLQSRHEDKFRVDFNKIITALFQRVGFKHKMFLFTISTKLVNKNTRSFVMSFYVFITKTNTALNFYECQLF